MIRSLLLAATYLLVLPASVAAQAGTLQPFRDQAEIDEFHRRLAEEWRRLAEQTPPPSEMEMMNRSHTMYPDPVMPVPPGTPRQQARPVGPDWEIAATHQAGGDPRELVAMAGGHLVLLRRGRLFSFRADGETLRLASSVDAAGLPGSGLTEYDELLAIGEHVVAIASSGGRNGTELGVFHVAPDGRLTHRATYSLTTGDDIAWHTYAARVVDGRLVLYAPLAVRGPATYRPALHRWSADGDSTTLAALPTRVHRPAGPVSATDDLDLHTAATCDLSRDGDLRCEFTGVVAPQGRALHVSRTAAYVWTAQGNAPDAAFVLYRIPLDGSAPTALRVSGTPADPSWVREGEDGHLNVVVRTIVSRPYVSDEVSTPSFLALLRVPLSEFGDGSRAAAPERYRTLPPASGGELKGGFVGDWLIYGIAPRSGKGVYNGSAVALRWADGRGVTRIALPHSVERVEPLGSGALLVGSDGESLHLVTLRLGPDSAVVVDRHAIPGSGHLARHGVFYRSDGRDAGVLAIAVRGPERPRDAPWLFGPGGIRFLRNRGLRLEEMGEIGAGAFTGDDACIRSCRNWFADTRPVFAGGRILALLGYEVVEAREDAGRIREVRRAGFTPAPPTSDLSGEWIFSEQIGSPGSRYWCHNSGTMRFTRAGDSLTVRYRQTGECTIDGVTSRSDGEGSATGRVSPNAVVFQSGPCRYDGYLYTLNSFDDGRMECRIPMADGTTLDLRGFWRARRSQP